MQEYRNPKCGREVSTQLHKSFALTAPGIRQVVADAQAPSQRRRNLPTKPRPSSWVASTGPSFALLPPPSRFVLPGGIVIVLYDEMYFVLRSCCTPKSQHWLSRSRRGGAAFEV